MFRSLLLILAVLPMFAVVVVFALSNPGTIDLDLAFSTVEDVKISKAFALTILFGWLWGVISMLAYVTGLWRDRRSLRKQVRLANLELNNLRALPVHDAG